MLIVNFKQLFREYKNVISRFCNKVDNNDYDDCYQYICLHILKYIWNYDINKATLDFYIYMMSQTGYRRFVLDKKEQQKFEENISSIDFETGFKDHRNIEESIYDIVDNIDNSMDLTVFYTILYNSTSSYTDMASRINMSTSEFNGRVANVREAAYNILK